MSSSASTDLTRSVAVGATAVLQVASAAATPSLLGPNADTGAISDANLSPVTPAGYAFAIWGLIYLASLALAAYQLLPSQRGREVHRRTGWWLAAAMTSSTIWIPIFGSRLLWLAQVVIIALVVFLLRAARQARTSGPAKTTAERWLVRLPITLYLGWATLATFAGFGTTFRSLGLPERGAGTVLVSLVLLAAATGLATLIIRTVTGAAAFAFTACWALIAVAVGTYVPPISALSVLATILLLATLALRVVRSPSPLEVLLG